jgi:cold shock protein
MGLFGKSEEESTTDAAELETEEVPGEAEETDLAEESEAEESEAEESEAEETDLAEESEAEETDLAEESEATERSTGTVAWFNVAKGYGFVEVDDHEEDAFIHYSEIDVDQKGFKKIGKGDRVEFDLNFPSDKGPEAVKLKVLESSSGSGNELGSFL